MTLEERVRRLEMCLTTMDLDEDERLGEEIRRDLAAESEAGTEPCPIAGAHGCNQASHATEPEHDIIINGWMQRCREAEADRDALRSQVADLTRERDSMVREAQRRGETIVEAVARAEKAERTTNAIQTVLAPLSIGGTPNADVADVVNSLVANRNDVIATLAARDATIAEARGVVDRLLASAVPHPVEHQGMHKAWTEALAWLAGQPAGAAGSKPSDAVDRPYHEQIVKLVKRERDAARAEVARLEGLVKRCERWIEWQLWTRCATPSEGTALLADLRAGRAS